jgi:hypothetical protein
MRSNKARALLSEWNIAVGWIGRLLDVRVHAKIARESRLPDDIVSTVSSTDYSVTHILNHFLSCFITLHFPFLLSTQNSL